MNIDSPQFPRRKVVIREDGSPSGFVLGMERSKLANYVAEQLNQQHSKDAEILEKFRRQAEELKKDKYKRLREQNINKNRSNSDHKFLEPLPIDAINGKIKHSESTHSSVSVDPVVYKKTSGLNRAAQRLVYREVGVETDTYPHELIKQLKQRDRVIKKQSIRLRKNQQNIKKMSHRIRRLEYNNMEKQQQQTRNAQKESYRKIQGLINSVSHQLIQNSSLLTNNLSSLTTPPRNLSLKQQPPQIYIPLSQSQFIEKPKKVKIEEPIGEPTITYNYSVQYEDEKDGLRKYIAQLNKSRNRLDVYADS